MKKSLFLGLTLASTALLTACGGSGSSSGSSNPTPLITNSNSNSGNTNISNTNNSSANNPSVGSTTNNNTQSNTNQTDTTISGTKITLRQVNNRVQSSEATTATPDKNIVVVNGQKITFIPQNSGVNITSNTINITDSSSVRMGSGSNLQYTRYGYVKEGQNSFLFAQGQKTADMPTSGEATYNGNATHIRNGEVKLYVAEFKVNYANKQLSGQIRDSTNTANPTVANLSATINGNTFSGISGSGVSTFTTTGNFYGPNAAEMGGTYKNSIGNISGAFGAKK